MITLPSDIFMTASSLCFDLTNITLNCSQNSYQSLQVTLNAITAGTFFGITVSSIRNAGSYKPMSGSFTFITKTSDQVSTFASGNYLASSDPSLTNSMASLFTDVQSSFSPGAYGTSESLTLKITPSPYIIPNYF